MKTSIIAEPLIAILLAALAMPAGAQDKREVIEGQTTIVLPDTLRYSAVGRYLIRLERRRSAAIAAHDTAWLRTIYSDDFEGVAANGQRVDRAILFGFFARDNPQARFRIDELKVRELGPSTATVMGRLVTLGPDGSVAAESRYLHVYVLRGGHWWIVAAEGSAVAVPRT